MSHKHQKEIDMELIERYLHEVGRHLPSKDRHDILAELRSHLTDTLEARLAHKEDGASEAEEADVVALLKEMGLPQKMALSYAPHTQYLIGPALYPLFRMVAGIVIAAVIGAQLLAYAIALWMGNQPLNPWETLVGMINSIPAAIGSLVIVFAILQWFDVRPELGDEPWDPRTLPEIEASEAVKPAERIAGIVFTSIVLAILAIFPGKVGFFIFPEGQFFTNPVILQYLGWIYLSLLAGIGLDIYLLWQGRWTTFSRAARIAVNLLSIAVLALLLQGHNAWLAARGAAGFFYTMEQFSVDVEANWQLVGMQAFRLAFGIALIVTIIETVAQVYRLLRSIWHNKPVAGALQA
jgi:hypothetical protein